jgi:hypothetical protein
MDGETEPAGSHSSIKTFDKSLLVLPGDYISWMEANDRLAFKNECAASAYAAA